MIYHNIFKISKYQIITTINDIKNFSFQLNFGFYILKEKLMSFINTIIYIQFK